MGSDGHLLALGLLRACGCLACQIVAAIALGSHHFRGGRLWDSHLACMHVPTMANLACLLTSTSATRPHQRFLTGSSGANLGFAPWCKFPCLGQEACHGRCQMPMNLLQSSQKQRDALVREACSGGALTSRAGPASAVGCCAPRSLAAPPAAHSGRPHCTRHHPATAHGGSGGAQRHWWPPPAHGGPGDVRMCYQSAWRSLKQGLKDT